MFTNAIENQVKAINQTSVIVKVRVSGPCSIGFNADAPDQDDCYTLTITDNSDNEFTMLDNLTLHDIGEMLETVQAFADLCG